LNKEEARLDIFYFVNNVFAYLQRRSALLFDKNVVCQRTEGYQKTVGFLKEQKALLIKGSSSKTKGF
jgi:hypothetical protein